VADGSAGKEKAPAVTGAEGDVKREPLRQDGSNMPHTTTISYSLGRSAYDSAPAQLHQPDFEAFCRWMRDHKIPATGKEAKGKAYICAPCAFAPDDDWHQIDKRATYIGGPHRCKRCSLPRRWLAFDVDHGLTADGLVALRAALAGVSCLIYTTASHTPEAPRVRIVVELDAPATRAQGGAASTAFRARIDMLLDITWDVATDRGEQPLYLPPADAKMWRVQGPAAVLSELLAEAPPAAPDMDDNRTLRAPRNAPESPSAAHYLAWLADSVEHAADGDRNAALYRAAADAAKVDQLTDAEIEAKLSAAAEAAGLDPGEIGKTLLSGLAHGRTQPARLMPEDEFDPLPADEVAPVGRAQINLAQGELPRMAGLCEHALLGANAPIYQRAGVVVQAVSEAKPPPHARVKRPPGSLRIRQMSVMSMRMSLEHVATFWTPDTRVGVVPGTLKRVGVPKEVAEAVLENGASTLYDLAGISLVPVLREDGSVAVGPGYDHQTGTLIATPNNWPLPPLDPTFADGKAASLRVRKYFRTMSFASPVAESVCLAAAISAVVRNSMDVCPMHAFTAPTAGSGKSKCTQMVAGVATGTTGPMATWSNTNSEENEKMLTGVVLDGDPVTILDNIDAPLRSSLLCSALSEPMMKLRKLGASDRHVAPCRTLMLATGNNMTVHGDLTRRVLLCTLDTGLERPELRHFDSDPVTEVLRDRVQIVNDILTMVIARIKYGPKRGPLWSDYRDWCYLVRDTLIWYGFADPVESAELQVAEDPERQMLGALLQSWQALYGGQELRPGDLLRGPSEFAESPNQDAQETMSELLKVIGGGRFMPDVRRLAQWLKLRKGRPVGGLYLHGEDDPKTKSTKWSVRVKEG